MIITKRKILLGCLGVVILCCCFYFVVAVIIVSTTSWDTVVKNPMHDPEFREGMEKLLDIEFPASAEWGKSEYRVWQDAIFNCVFTLPKRDIDIMFPPNEVTWHENDRDMLPQWSKDWLKGKKLDHFNVMECKPKERLFVTVVVDNPPGISGDQRVWVYINFWRA